MTRRYVKSEDAVRRVAVYLWERRDEVVGMDDICAGTGLDYPQVAAAERSLKKFVADNIHEFQGYTLYIAIGNSGEHGFIRESRKTVLDQIARARYMLTRTRSELAYTRQAAERILDDAASRRLSRSVLQFEAAAATLEDVLERAQEASAVAG